jgi:hypothetical protein
MSNVDITRITYRLLVSPQHLCVLSLLEACRDFLGILLTPENCTDIMRFAWDLRCPGLEDDVRFFVTRNSVEVLQQSDEPLQLPPD